MLFSLSLSLSHSLSLSLSRSLSRLSLVSLWQVWTQPDGLGTGPAMGLTGSLSAELSFICGPPECRWSRGWEDMVEGQIDSIHMEATSEFCTLQQTPLCLCLYIPTTAGHFTLR